MTNREDEILANIGPTDASQTLDFARDSPLGGGGGGGGIVLGDSPILLATDSNGIDNTPNANGITTSNHNKNASALSVVAPHETNQNNEQNNGEGGGPISELWAENPPSSASSGFSDDDSLAGTEGDPKTIDQIVQMVKERGRQGLIKEYAEIRARAPDGTFTNAR